MPVLYPKAFQEEIFGEALSWILGAKFVGLSGSNIVRLKECGQKEDEAWAKGDLSTKRCVYIWAEGMYFSA